MQDEPELESDPNEARRSSNRRRIAIVALILVWTFFYNLLIKEQTPWTAFFQLLDTISDDFVMGAMLTIGVGLGIVAVFSLTKLYTQIIANVHSFRMIEDLVHDELRRGKIKSFLGKILTLEDQPRPATVCPRHVSSLILSFCFIYLMSWVYVVLFSEALHFVSWSAGVRLPLDNRTLHYLPTLGLAIPFSARVMAYLRYPYAQDYADFMPGAVFVLLLVAALGSLFESEDLVSFLVGVANNSKLTLDFLRNGAFLAFIPVFFEGAFWLVELSREDDRQE